MGYLLCLCSLFGGQEAPNVAGLAKGYFLFDRVRPGMTAKEVADVLGVTFDATLVGGTKVEIYLRYGIIVEYWGISDRRANGLPQAVRRVSYSCYGGLCKSRPAHCPAH